MSYSPFARSRIGLATASLLAAALGGVAAHASWRRARTEGEAERVRELVRLVGTPDLVLSTNARWLRHPSQTEAGAAASDGPLFFDADPAGALIGPPIPILGSGAREPAKRAP